MTLNAMPIAPPPTSARGAFKRRFASVRAYTDALCQPLAIEDQVVQPIDDVSPPKWHLAHTTWFFETVVLSAFVSDYRPFHPRYNELFNSYYESFGPRVARGHRGALSRPTVAEVHAYRRAVNGAMERLFSDVAEARWPAFARLAEIGLQHEQQHQELLVTDIKYILGTNPLRPAYTAAVAASSVSPAVALSFLPFRGGLLSIGAQEDGFAWDNERPAHKTYVAPFRLANRCVTNGEFLAFVQDGGYETFRWWLSDGWELKKRFGWAAPLYWEKRGEDWMEMTLAGLRPLDLAAPVCHVNYFEADAYARWAGKRLPAEMEWEAAAKEGGLDMIGRVWEWTASAYLPYPGFRAESGALGEYNGKFMSGQMVLRGGSVATPPGHIRLSYRNFFQPDKRWQFSGIRLAEDATEAGAAQ